MSAHITGIGESDTVGVVKDKNSLVLQAEAALNCCADAGRSIDEVEVLIAGPARHGGYDRQSAALSQYLGVQPKHSATVKASGSTALTSVVMAAGMLEGGFARNALVVMGDSLRSGVGRSEAVNRLAEGRDSDWELPYGPLVASMFALAASEFMASSGATAEDLAAVAVNMRTHASMNPRAQMRDPIDLRDVLASPIVSSPLHRLDCSILSDGGAAVYLERRDEPSKRDRPGVRIAGAGGTTSHENLMSVSDPLAGLRRAAHDAFEMADMAPDDIDFLGIYDCFTPTVLMQLAAIGISDPREAGAEMRGGRFRFDGAKPMNTHGGLLSYCHMGSGAGLYHLIEAVRQHRGEAGDRQTEICRRSLITALGGILAISCVVILEAEQ